MGSICFLKITVHVCDIYWGLETSLVNILWGIYLIKKTLVHLYALKETYRGAALRLSCWDEKQQYKHVISFPLGQRVGHRSPQLVYLFYFFRPRWHVAHGATSLVSWLIWERLVKVSGRWGLRRGESSEQEKSGGWNRDQEFYSRDGSVLKKLQPGILKAGRGGGDSRTHSGSRYRCDYRFKSCTWNLWK